MRKLSETPRTDAAYHSADYEYEGVEDEAWAFARKLERELNELTRDNENHKIRILCLGKELEELRELELDKLKAEPTTL